MRHNSQETLRRVTQNDPSLVELTLVGDSNIYGDDEFYSDNSDDYSTLGAAIANNTHLENLIAVLSYDLPLGVANRGFYDGLKSNSSIHQLTLFCCGRNIAGWVVGQEILQTYQENNSHLTVLSIGHSNLQSGGDRVIGDTLSNCRNLKIVALNNCNITDAQLLTIVGAIRAHHRLEELGLGDNNIGNAGCDAIATLLADPNCNLRHLCLGHNAIAIEGSTAIFNSLTNNNKLWALRLHMNPINQSVQDVFCRVLCNNTSINDIYSSNHTLKTLDLGQQLGQQLRSLLIMNEGANKSHVAIRKILKYHPNIDMEPFFEWGMEEEGEHSLKALPYVMDWFERAEEAVADDDESSNSEGGGYNIQGKKLSAIYDFSRAMPLLLEGISSMKVDSNKRKRSMDCGR